MSRNDFHLLPFCTFSSSSSLSPLFSLWWWACPLLVRSLWWRNSRDRPTWWDSHTYTQKLSPKIHVKKCTELYQAQTLPVLVLAPAWLVSSSSPLCMCWLLSHTVLMGAHCYQYSQPSMFWVQRVTLLHSAWLFLKWTRYTVPMNHMYSAFRKYSQPLTYFTLCCYSLNSKWIKCFFSHPSTHKYPIRTKWKCV